MKREDNWNECYHNIVSFINSNKRKPSKYILEERQMVHWLKYNKRSYSSGKMNESRQQMFQELLQLLDKYRRINQYAYCSYTEEEQLFQSS